uniref:Uncharacterized protein n=1 Tax=Octopus bimaculoides TaxID=37653 RepID=A0A0L8FXT8_OCTBM
MHFVNVANGRFVTKFVVHSSKASTLVYFLDHLCLFLHLSVICENRVLLYFFCSQVPCLWIGICKSINFISGG